jgi:hypothetical protein
MKGRDSVFHLAAIGSVQESGQKPNECAEIQCLGCSDCLEEAARANSRRHFVRARDTSAVCRAIALWAGIACSPCANAYNNRQSVCRNNLCMQAITVDDVF